MSHRTAAAALLARQDGLITRQQARDLDLSDQVIRGFRQRGEWLPMLPGVFRVVESRPSPEQRVRAASLWAGESSCVSGIAAAAWWRLIDDSPQAVQLTIPRNRGLRAQPGVQIRRRYLHPQDRVVVRGVCVTDRVKQNALVRSGLRVYRFTWFDLTQRPDAVVAEMRAALAAAA